MTTRIIVGDCLAELRKLDAASVHCAISSPPYWGLRDYGVQPNIWGGDPVCEHEFKRGDCIHCGAWRGVFGLEPTPDMFIEHLVEIFEEVRQRVLRDDGTLWLNLGDSYYSTRNPGGIGENSTINGTGSHEQLRLARQAHKRARGHAPHEVNERNGHEGKHRYRVGSTRAQRGDGNDGEPYAPMSQPNRMPIEGSDLKPKDLVGIPWMAAFALRKAGWYLRSDCIWHKPNPMPESTEDRPTKAHEYLFLLSKSEHYFYDHEAIKEEASDNSHPRKAANGKSTTGRAPAVTPKSVEHGLGIKANESFHAAVGELVGRRNKRSVWTVATQPFPEAHFATFPPALIEPCVMAGTSERCCSSCRAPFERITVSTTRHESNSGRAGNPIAGKGHVSSQVRDAHDVRNGPVADVETIGWYPTCGCEGLEVLPPYPRSPQDKSEDAKAKWRAACALVTAKRRLLCEPAAKLKTVPAVVLDPFGGAGTTGLVADRLQRDAILIELNPEYAMIAARRLKDEGGMLVDVRVEEPKKEAAE